MERIEAATLCVTGWRDLVCEAMIDAYERIPASKRLVAGPWMHEMPQDAPQHAVDFLPLMLSWWDRWLRGTPNGADEGPAAIVYTQGRDQWATLDRWPGGDQATVSYALSADGALGGLTYGELTTVADATVGTHGGLAWYQTSGAYGMPDDQYEDDRRSLAFTSEPLSAPLEMLGRPRVRLTLTEAASDGGPVVAKLVDVDSAGRSHPITSGTCIPDNDVVEIDLVPTNYEVPAGHRLRVTVARDDFPHLWPHPDAQPVTVVCDPQRAASAITLPLAPTDGRASYQWAEFDPKGPALLLADPPPSAEYEVARELVGDRARVTIAERYTQRTPHAGGEVTMTSTVTAEVAAHAPEEARLTAEASAAFTLDDAQIDVQVHLVVDGERAVATGTVTKAGVVDIDRRWDLRAPSVFKS